MLWCASHEIRLEFRYGAVRDRMRISIHRNNLVIRMLLILNLNIAVLKGGSTMHCKGEIIFVYSSLLDIKTKLKCVDQRS